MSGGFKWGDIYCEMDTYPYRTERKEESTDMDQREALSIVLKENDAIPEEYRPLMTGVLESADGNVLGAILRDAVRAKQLMDSGQGEEARAIIEQYRDLAESAGMGAIFEQMLGSILIRDDCV
jgi:hypothetical protein